MPCLRFSWPLDTSDDHLERTAHLLADTICPVLLETVVKGMEYAYVYLFFWWMYLCCFFIIIVEEVYISSHLAIACSPNSWWGCHIFNSRKILLVPWMRSNLSSFGCYAYLSTSYDYPLEVTSLYIVTCWIYPLLWSSSLRHRKKVVLCTYSRMKWHRELVISRWS